MYNGLGEQFTELNLSFFTSISIGCVVATLHSVCYVLYILLLLNQFFSWPLHMGCELFLFICAPDFRSQNCILSKVFFCSYFCVATNDFSTLPDFDWTLFAWNQNLDQKKEKKKIGHFFL